MMRDTLHGKTAFVTGASDGIGAATARALAAEGARVVIGYHNGKSRSEALCADLPGEGHVIQQIDIGDPASVSAAAARIAEQFTTLDILVNSAGATQPIPHADLDTLDEGLFDRLLHLNAGGPFSVIRRHMPLLQASGEAVVVNVSSISAFTGSGSNIAYCAAKAALDTMTKSFARAFGPEVRFLAVSPAAVATGFVAGRDRAALENAARSVPLGRVVEPEDVASAILACITHLKSATGTTIVVDGGRQL